MARCGCKAKCNCAFDAGVCTEIELTATPQGCESPTFTYAVNVVTDDETVFCGPNGLNAVLTTQDTNTVDLEGAGTIANPLEANVILTPDAQVPDPDGLGTGNLIEEGTPGIYVSCEDVQDCVGSAIDAVTADCLEYDDTTNTISIAICGEPNGVECIAAGDPNCPDGGLAVFPSADADNTLTFGTDDRLFAEAGAIVPGECMTFSGAGTQADPFVLTPLIAPEQNGLECVPGSGLLVTPSSDPNNGLVFGTDQRLYVDRCPLILGGAQVLVGNDGPCFEFTGDGCTTPLVATMRLSDDVCQGLECRADGLYVNKDPTPLPASVEDTIVVGPRGPFNGTQQFTNIVPPTCLTLTNPSTCRDMAFAGYLNGFAEVGRTSGEMRILIRVSVGGIGGPYFTVSQISQANPTPPSRLTGQIVFSGNETVLGPGGTHTLCSQVDISTAAAVNGRVFAAEFTRRIEARWAE